MSFDLLIASGLAVVKSLEVQSNEEPNRSLSNMALAHDALLQLLLGPTPPVVENGPSTDFTHPGCKEHNAKVGDLLISLAKLGALSTCIAKWKVYSEEQLVGRHLKRDLPIENIGGDDKKEEKSEADGVNQAFRTIIFWLEDVIFAYWPLFSPSYCSVKHNFPPKLPEVVPRREYIQVKTEAAARLDLAGGWSDTPPLTYLCQSEEPAVLNMAVKVDGKKPISCDCRWSSEIEGIFLQLGALQLCGNARTLSTPTVIHYERPLEIFANCSLPCHPGSLICAVLVASGLVREVFPLREEKPHHRFEFRGWRGLLIEVNSTLPQGSGLGVSSILASALLAALWKLDERTFGRMDLIEAVMKIEQLHTSGAGWQDSIGGVAPGFKLTTLKRMEREREKLHIDHIGISEELAIRLERRLIIIYSGRTRVAKDLLRRVMLRWFRGNRAIVNATELLIRGAKAGANLLKKGEFPGAACVEYHELKKTFAPSTETEAMSALRSQLRVNNISHTLWVAGAGGGGFLACYLHRGKSVKDVEDVLRGNKIFTDMWCSSVEMDDEPLLHYCYYSAPIGAPPTRKGTLEEDDHPLIFNLGQTESFISRSVFSAG